MSFAVSQKCDQRNKRFCHYKTAHSIIKVKERVPCQ